MEKRKTPSKGIVGKSGSNKKMMRAVIVLLVVVVALVVFVVLRPPEITTKEDAEKSGQGVLKDIGDIKSTLQEIRDNLKKG